MSFENVCRRRINRLHGPKGIMYGKEIYPPSMPPGLVDKPGWWIFLPEVPRWIFFPEVPSAAAHVRS